MSGAGAARRGLSYGDHEATLRLPTGAFYSRGVKNESQRPFRFVDRKPASETPWIRIRELWVYDLRTSACGQNGGSGGLGAEGAAEERRGAAGGTHRTG